MRSLTFTRKRSSTSMATSSPMNPHFFKPLLLGFHSHLNIPVAFFSKHFEQTQNHGNAVVRLRSDASDVTWEVKMDGRRLTQGWQKFAASHDLRVGDIVIFRHDGDFLLHVSFFGPSCCEIRYNHDDDDDDDDDDSSFVACVTASNLSTDMVILQHLPMDFSRYNGLTNRNCEIILLNEESKQWRLLMRHHKASGHVCIRSGWKRFCYENRRRANDFLTFKLVRNGATPVLQLCSSSSSSTTRPCRFVILTLTPYSLKSSTLVSKFLQQHFLSRVCKWVLVSLLWQRLPMKFVKANGIENARKITLVDRHGNKKTTSLKQFDKYGRLSLGKEWKEFCEVNKVKTGESFKLELIKEEDTGTHLLKFCSKV
ncbi:B3 domain-containing protein REM8 isoform X1 [Brassica rapa]|uniref:B3 domain-containing protein REM8 isoform X1 n=1 Tax=Brassica campestris TaxID=3711 RepID=UPI00142DFFA7|nr:B3 domain-containing protein REM8 isoform X1 [Brassica rapa]